MPHSGHSDLWTSDLVQGRLSSRRSASSPSAADDPCKSQSLTFRQAEVLHWIAEGRTNGEIATILGCSAETVKNHVKQIFQRLGVHTRTAAAAHAYRQIIAQAERLRSAASPRSQPQLRRRRTSTR